jgi:hypothetical protein
LFGKAAEVAPKCRRESLHAENSKRERLLEFEYPMAWGNSKRKGMG